MDFFSTKNKISCETLINLKIWVKIFKKVFTYILFHRKWYCILFKITSQSTYKTNINCVHKQRVYKNGVSNVRCELDVLQK